MLDQYHVTALIPARGGSKRLPRKNIKLLCNKPLIAWTIETARKSKFIDSVVVSTDDINIKEIAERLEVNVPFLRPASLSNDTASSFDVIEHAIKFLNIDKENHLIILMQPTSPLRTVEELDKALEFFIEKKASGVVSVSKCEHNPLWANTLPLNKNMRDFLKEEIRGKRSQDLEIYYRLNGSIYIYETLSLIKHGNLFYDERVFAFETSLENSVDIDTELDFKIAETILNHKLKCN